MEVSSMSMYVTDFLGKKARIGETASCNYKCARLHGQKSLQGAILEL